MPSEIWSWSVSFAPNAEEEKAVGGGAGDCFGHSRERPVHRPFELEALGQNADLQHPALVKTSEDLAWRRQSRIAFIPVGSGPFIHWNGRRWSGRNQTQVGVVAQFRGS